MVQTVHTNTRTHIYTSYLCRNLANRFLYHSCANPSLAHWLGALESLTQIAFSRAHDTFRRNSQTAGLLAARKKNSLEGSVEAGREGL